MTATDASESVSLERAGADEAPLLFNLLEFYIHDLSDIFPATLGPDGRFGYERLSVYWSDPDARRAFLIRCGGRVAGFALVTRGSPATTDPTDLDVAEFFVLRSYRRLGVGRQAARSLWDGLPGHWVVRVSEANRAGLLFWGEVVRAYAGQSCTETTRAGRPHCWRVFTLTSPASVAKPTPGPGTA